MKRWVVLAAGVVLQSVLGGVYAWSAFVPGLCSEYGMTNGQCGLIFGITIAAFTVTMIPSGRFMQKFGPRAMASGGALLFAAGYILASFSDGNFAVILAGIGILTGAGIGIGYVCPLTVGMKWFPDNKGLVTGVAVAGFGGGAIFLSYLAQYMLGSLGWGTMEVFRFIGIALGAVALAAALFLSEPQKSSDKSTAEKKEPKDIKQFVLSRPFILLCVGMFAGTFAGLLTVGNLKPILLGAGFNGKAATLGISVFAIGNALGRIIWGQIYDRLSGRRTVLLSLASLAVALIPLAVSLPQIIIFIAVGIAGAGFGACFVVYASSIVSYYGTEFFPRLYPICFIGYGLAGISGPAIGGRIADVSGSFTIGIILSVSIILAAVALIALALPGRDAAVKS